MGSHTDCLVDVGALEGAFAGGDAGGDTGIASSAGNTSNAGSASSATDCGSRLASCGFDSGCKSSALSMFAVVNSETWGAASEAAFGGGAACEIWDVTAGLFDSGFSWGMMLDPTIGVSMQAAAARRLLIPCRDSGLRAMFLSKYLSRRRALILLELADQ